MELEASGLQIGYGEHVIVNQMDVSIARDKITTIIGPNGSGKTTVYNALTGVYTPTAGQVVFNGTNITGKPMYDMVHYGIARTFQNIRLFNNMSVLDNVKTGLHNQNKYSVPCALLKLPSYYKKEAAMDKKAMELLKVFDLDKEASLLACNLPYGKQRKLEIARALATNPKLLLLDEPAAGMNPNETQELMDTIRFVRDEFDMTILLIEHDMRLVSGICEELTVLNFGKVLAQGETSAVLQNPEVVTAYLGE